MSARLGAAFAPRAPLRDRIQVGPWPTPLPDWFWTWCAWVDHGKPTGKRPPSAPLDLSLPQYRWVWRRYALHKKQRPPVVGPPPQPPIPSAPSPYLRAVIAAEDPLAAEGLPPSYPIFLTPDPAYALWTSQSVVDRLRSGGRTVGAWCNPTQVPASRLREFAAQYGLAPLMGQAETAEEFDASLAAGLGHVVGNASSLTAEQKRIVKGGGMGFTQEDYWNVQPWLVPDWEGLPILCSCPGLYSGEGQYGRYVPLEDFVATGRFVVGRDGFYHAAGPKEADRSGDYALLT